MTKKNHIRRIIFFVVMVIALVSLAAVAVAESTDPCPSGTQHKGPFSYRNRENATCTETGKQDKYCDACGRFVGTEIISAIGHQYESSTRVITPPTCLTAGLQQKKQICKVCGYETNTTDEAIPALGHDWGSWAVTTPATCLAGGTETRVCKRDASHVETRPIPALGHNWGEWTRTKQPTCEGSGEDTRICKNDSSHKETRPVNPLGHNWDGGVVTRQPNCTTPGVRTYTCKNNPSHTYTESIPVVPDAHVWDNGKVTKAPTCATPGERTYTCQINSAHTRVETIPIDPNAHDWGPRIVIKAATCDEPGQAQYVCRNDPSHVKNEVIPATGHNWDKGTITKQPTMTEPGEKKYVCQNDPSHTKTEVLPTKTLYNNTVCAFGPRLEDKNTVLYPFTTDRWYMFTPFDASKEGRQTYELVASNQYIVGSLTLDIKDGYVTVDYKLTSPSKFDITLEFFTILNRIQDITHYEPEELLSMKMNTKQPINLAQNFGDDTNLVLYFCSRCNYTGGYPGLNYNSNAHQALLRAMDALMD